jgi:hypothetical protein
MNFHFHLNEFLNTMCFLQECWNDIKVSMTLVIVLKTNLEPINKSGLLDCLIQWCNLLLQSWLMNNKLGSWNNMKYEIQSWCLVIYICMYVCIYIPLYVRFNNQVPNRCFYFQNPLWQLENNYKVSAINIASFFGRFSRLWTYNIMRPLTTIFIASFCEIGET